LASKCSLTQLLSMHYVLTYSSSNNIFRTFLLKNRKLGNVVCVKTVEMKNHQSLTGNAKLRYVRFVQKECHLHLSFDHPNIIKLYHGVFGKRFVYMFMEYAPNTFLDLICKCILLHKLQRRFLLTKLHFFNSSWQITTC
jgi:hypothetical protein